MTLIPEDPYEGELLLFIDNLLNTISEEYKESKFKNDERSQKMTIYFLNKKLHKVKHRIQNLEVNCQAYEKTLKVDISFKDNGLDFNISKVL